MNTEPGGQPLLRYPGRDSGHACYSRRDLQGERDPSQVAVRIRAHLRRGGDHPVTKSAINDVRRHTHKALTCANAGAVECPRWCSCSNRFQTSPLQRRPQRTAPKRDPKDRDVLNCNRVPSYQVREGGALAGSEPEGAWSDGARADGNADGRAMSGQFSTNHATRTPMVDVLLTKIVNSLCAVRTEVAQTLPASPP